LPHIDAGKTTLPSAYFITQGKPTKSAILTKAQRKWTGWNRKEKGDHYRFRRHDCLLERPQNQYNDTPGHVDFTAEVRKITQSLRRRHHCFWIAEEGVQSQSETVWRQADKYKVPRLCFVNKMDKLGADFLATVKSIEDRLGANPLIMVLPIGGRTNIQGYSALDEMKAYIWGSDELGAEFEVTDEFRPKWRTSQEIQAQIN